MILLLGSPFYLSLAALTWIFSPQASCHFIFLTLHLLRPHLCPAVASWGHSGSAGCCFSAWTMPRTKPASPTGTGCLTQLSSEVTLTRSSHSLGMGLGEWHKGSKTSRGPCPLTCSSKAPLSGEPYSQANPMLCSSTGPSSHEDMILPHPQGPLSAKAFG